MVGAAGPRPLTRLRSEPPIYAALTGHWSFVIGHFLKIASPAGNAFCSRRGLTCLVPASAGTSPANAGHLSYLSSSTSFPWGGLPQAGLRGPAQPSQPRPFSAAPPPGSHAPNVFGAPSPVSGVPARPAEAMRLQLHCRRATSILIVPPPRVFVVKKAGSILAATVPPLSQRDTRTPACLSPRSPGRSDS